MSCERYRNALAAVAAGDPARPDLEAHLDSCAACRAELDGLRQALGLADSTLRLIVTAAPSPDLPARIRRAVGESREATVGKPLPWRWAWTALAAVCLVAAVAVWHRTPAADTRRVGEAAPVAPVSSEPATRIVSSVANRGQAHPAVGRDTVARRGVRTTSRRPAPAEVLIPAGQEETLWRLVTVVQRDRLTLPSLAAAGPPLTDLSEPAAIAIEPVEIVPLDPAEEPGT